MQKSGIIWPIINLSHIHNLQDTHPDLYETFDNNPFSHASPFARIMENDLAKERSILFDMGCVQEERISNCGKIFANVKISNKELDKFMSLKGFELCHDEDILLA